MAYEGKSEQHRLLQCRPVLHGTDVTAAQISACVACEGRQSCSHVSKTNPAANTVTNLMHTNAVTSNLVTKQDCLSAFL